MTTFNLLLTLVSVAMICAGQLLFKWIGLRLHTGIPLLDTRIMLAGLLSIALYGSATLLWIWILRSTPLTRAYPFMALSFVLVPLGGVLLFSERVNGMYLIGLALIIVGVMMTAFFRS